VRILKGSCFLIELFGLAERATVALTSNDAMVRWASSTIKVFSVALRSVLPAFSTQVRILTRGAPPVPSVVTQVPFGRTRREFVTSSQTLR
jgi:hypothetical protein